MWIGSPTPGSEVDTGYQIFLEEQLARSGLDEIVTLRRPRSMMVELDEHVDEKSRQDEVLEQAAAPSASRRQLIIE